jgi:hypothetical protein
MTLKQNISKNNIAKKKINHSKEQVDYDLVNQFKLSLDDFKKGKFYKV